MSLLTLDVLDELFASSEPILPLIATSWLGSDDSQQLLVSIFEWCVWAVFVIGYTVNAKIFVVD